MPIGIPTICWYTMSPNCTYIFSMRKVKASLNSVQVQHLYESYVLLEKNPALSEVQRYVFDTLLKHHLTRDNTFSLIRSWEVKNVKVYIGRRTDGRTTDDALWQKLTLVFSSGELKRGSNSVKSYDKWYLQFSTNQLIHLLGRAQ